MHLHNRQIKATFWNDTDLLMWPRDKRWFYEGLFHLSDDSGCLEDSPFAFKLTLFPSPIDADITSEIISAWRDELISDGKLVRYNSGRKDCLYLTNFHKHQSLKNPQKPDVPLPPWIIWEPHQSNNNAGKYKVSDDVLTEFLHSSYDVLPREEKRREIEVNLSQEKRREVELQAAMSEVTATEEQKESSSSLDTNLSAIVQIYEREGFGQLTNIVGEQLHAILTEFGVEWSKMALAEAVKANKRTLKYVAGILRNWRAEGGPRDSNARAPNTSHLLSQGPKGNTANGQKDERYSAFYQLFPDT